MFIITLGSKKVLVLKNTDYSPEVVFSRDQRKVMFRHVPENTC